MRLIATEEAFAPIEYIEEYLKLADKRDSAASRYLAIYYRKQEMVRQLTDLETEQIDLACSRALVSTERRQREPASSKQTEAEEAPRPNAATSNPSRSLSTRKSCAVANCNESHFGSCSLDTPIAATGP